MQISSAISHFVFGFLFALMFGLYGISFVAGFYAGAELMQTCYRSFRDGYKWGDVWKKPLILLNYAHPKDTLLDGIAYFAGTAVGYIIRKLSSNA